MLSTALLPACSYAPDVLLSIFAGALSDRWNRKTTMLVCDTLAAAATLAVWFLPQSGNPQIGHLYLINAVNGLMNSVQQPAPEVAISLITPKEQYHRVGGDAVVLPFAGDGPDPGGRHRRPPSMRRPCPPCCSRARAAAQRRWGL